MHVLCIAQGTSAQVGPVRLERVLRHLALRFKHVSLLLPHESMSPLRKADIAKLKIPATVDVYHASSKHWFSWWAKALSIQLLQKVQPELVCFIQPGSSGLLKYIKKLQNMGSTIQTLFVRLAQTKPLPWYKALWQFVQEDAFLRHTQVVVSDSQQYCLNSKRRVPPQKVHYAPIVPVDMKAIAKVPAPPVAWDISVVTPLLPGSGLDALLEAAAQIKQCRVLIIGDGPDRYRLERRIVQLELEGKVQLTGWFPNLAQVIASLKSTRMFVMNSVHLQSQYALVQAMMSSVPVITLQTELTRGIIDPPQNGLHTTGTVADLKQNIEWYLAHKDRRTFMAEKALDDAKQFDTASVEEQWNEVLDVVAG